MKGKMGMPRGFVVGSAVVVEVEEDAILEGGQVVLRFGDCGSQWWDVDTDGDVYVLLESIVTQCVGRREYVEGLQE